MTVLMTIIAATPAWADREIFSSGGRGDATYADVCKPGQYLAGVRGRKGAWMDQIGILCRPVLAGGAFGEVDRDYPLRGGQGGGEFGDVVCPPNTIIVEIYTRLHEDGKQVKRIAFTCRSAQALGGDTYVVAGSHSTARGEEDGAYIPGACPTLEVASGLHGWYGAHVNSAGLMCRPFVIPAAPPPKTQLTPESKAPLGTAADFGGIWLLKTVQNAEYDLTLNVDGDKVTGDFRNTANSIYNGTLTGTVKGGRLSFQWSTPANGAAKGTGDLRVHTDGTLGGGVTVPRPGDKPIYYRWYARQISRQAPRPKAPEEPAGDPSGFVGLWGGQNSIWGSFQLNLTAGENGAVQGPISGAATGFVQGRVRADGRTYVFTFNSSYLGATGSGALVLSADGKGLGGDTVFSNAGTRGVTVGRWNAARIDTAQAGATPPASTRRATAIADVDMYIGPSGDTPVLGIWRKDARAVPLQSQDGWCKLQGINDGEDAWVWGESVSGCN